LARLDKITADKLKRKQRWQLLKSQNDLSSKSDSSGSKQQESPEVLQMTPSGEDTSPVLVQNRMLQQGGGGPGQEGEEGTSNRLSHLGGGGEEEEMEVDGKNGGLPEMVFGDEDSTDKGESERYVLEIIMLVM
jgi:hypothetical protein